MGHKWNIKRAIYGYKEEKNSITKSNHWTKIDDGNCLFHASKECLGNMLLLSGLRIYKGGGTQSSSV